jgi:hypothetical protein
MDVHENYTQHQYEHDTDNGSVSYDDNHTDIQIDIPEVHTVDPKKTKDPTLGE